MRGKVKIFFTLAALCILLTESFCYPAFAIPENNPIAQSDREFLEKIEKESFIYFQKFINQKTGLVLDSSSPGSPSSIAATGFACAAYAIAQSHGWIGYREAYQMIERIFETLETKAAGKNGFYFHFLDPSTGSRTWSSEISSIDTALLMAGILLAGEYFKGTELETRAQKLYAKVNWKWMTNGSLLISHGWKPKQGFLPYYWDMYSEHLIMLALAMGSPTYPVPQEAWTQWKRTEDTYNGRKIVYSFSGSLFTYQYSQAFIDFRFLKDGKINYFENSKQATLANKEFCLEHKSEYPASYDETIWGLSASLGPDGYKPYGAEPGQALHDGTIAPYSIVSSIVFTPKESITALHTIDERYHAKIYGPYGFKDAFNADRNWWANEYLGIDQGITVIMLENFLNDGAIWKKFMHLESIQRWIKLSGLKFKTESDLTS